MDLNANLIRVFGPAVNHELPYVDFTFENVSISGEVTVSGTAPDGSPLGPEVFSLEKLKALHESGLVADDTVVPEPGTTTANIPAGSIGWDVLNELHALYTHTGDSAFLDAAREAFTGLNVQTSGGDE